MPQIGTLTTGAAVVTTIPGNAQCEAMIILGDVDTANPLTGIQVEIDGTSFINIVGAQTLVSAFMKWMSQVTGTVIGNVLKIATGKIGRSTTYRFTNSGAFTPAIFATSDAPDGVPLLAGTKQINALSYEDFSKFSALFIQTPANVTQVEIAFMNGHKGIFAIQEIDSLFALSNQSEADGRLGGVSVIDNRNQSIKACRIYCSTANTILVVKLPDAAFEVMKDYAKELNG